MIRRAGANRLAPRRKDGSDRLNSARLGGDQPELDQPSGGQDLWPTPRPKHQPNQVGLLAVDIDGTLVTGWPEQISPRTAAAIQRAAGDKRLELVLATGRGAYSTMSIAKRFGLDSGWAICSNGSLTLRLNPQADGGYQIVNQVTFDPRPALEAIVGLLPPSAAVAVEEVGVGHLVTKPFPEGELDGRVTVVDFDTLVAQPTTRVILRATDLTPQTMEQVIAASNLPAVNYAIGWTGWVDLNPPGISKASALESLRLQLGVPPGGTVAIGDGGNDIAMLSWASRGVAVAGSSERVVAAASEVTGSVEQDGAAQVIEDVLNRL